MKLKEQKVKKDVPVRTCSALLIIVGIAVLAVLAIFLGNRRKKNTL